MNGATSRRYRSTATEMKMWRNAIMSITEEIRPATVRQVFYQCVVRDLIEKSESGYKRVASTLVDLRKAGRMPYDWLARHEHAFSHALPIQIPEESVRAARADQLENFLVSEYLAGRRYTKRQLEDGKHIDIPRAELRAALAELEVSGRVVGKALPKSEVSGARKTYLHPIKRLPNAPNDCAATEGKSGEKEAA